MGEVINPPEYYFPNIDFNPEFYGLDTGIEGISQETANALYLKKTVIDTATALETFTSGIQTLTISSTGTGASNILNIGVDPRTVAGAIHHYSDGDNCVAGAGVHLNNGLNNNSATNIHNGTGANATGAVNIMSGSANSGTITIGNETTNNTTTTLRGNTTITNPIFSPTTLTTYSAPILSQMYFIRRTNSGFQNLTTAYKAFAPYNALASGVYLLFAFIYLTDGFPITKITCSLGISSSAMTNGQTGGFTVLNDNTLEAYDYKSTTGGTGGNRTLNISGIYTVTSPNNNIAIAVSVGVTGNSGYMDLKLCRIG
jgi:hypothetical protein